MSAYESFEDRLVRQRAERAKDAEKTRKEQELARAKRDSERRFSNPARKEEAVARYKELLSPQQPALKPKVAQDSNASGKPVEFYTWKDGVVGKLKILTEGEFTPV